MKEPELYKGTRKRLFLPQYTPVLMIRDRRPSKPCIYPQAWLKSLRCIVSRTIQVDAAAGTPFRRENE